MKYINVTVTLSIIGMEIEEVEELGDLDQTVRETASQLILDGMGKVEIVN